LDNVTQKIKVDFRSEEPIYLQIARQIQELVGNGGLVVGDQLPTVREMATELSINFNTVARAYRLLDEARLISTQRGRGTYIWEKPGLETMKLLKEEALENILTKMMEEAKQLGFSMEEVKEVMEHLQTSKKNDALIERNIKEKE